MAVPTTNIPANRTTVSLDRPEKVSLGVRTPHTPKVKVPNIEVTATGISSVTNRKATTPSTIKVIVA
jgi:hypothetical protein